MHVRSFTAGALAAVFLAGTAAAQTVSVLTTQAGSFTNSVGQAIGKIITEKSGLRAVVQAQSGTGYNELEEGIADFNFGNGIDAVFFTTGKGEYEGQPPKKNLRIAGALMPYVVAFYVRADSDIKSIADLKGKRVSSGFATQKTIGRIIEAHLANAGLSYKDVAQVPAPNVLQSSQDFIAGKTDVLYFAIGSAAVKQAQASVGALRVLPLDDSPEAVGRMQQYLPGSFITTVTPGPNREGISQPTKVVAFDNLFLTHAKASDDVVYKSVKAVHDNKAGLVQIFPGFAEFNPDAMAKPYKEIPFHPGAAKFYREIGLLPKS
jgi:TRAP transporter TAXI family solute receptor